MERTDDDELRRWLREDAPHGDLTTRALHIGDRAGQLRFEARASMRVAVVEEAVPPLPDPVLDAIVQAALAKDPKDRIQHACELATRLSN